MVGRFWGRERSTIAGHEGSGFEWRPVLKVNLRVPATVPVYLIDCVATRRVEPERSSQSDETSRPRDFDRHGSAEFAAVEDSDVAVVGFHDRRGDCQADSRAGISLMTAVRDRYRRSNTFSVSGSPMPIPVSITSIVAEVSSVRSRTSTVLPGRVNSMALERRLSSTWPMRTGSQNTWTGGRGTSYAEVEIGLLGGELRRYSPAPCTAGTRSTISARSWIPSPEIVARVSRSSTRRSSRLALRVMIDRVVGTIAGRVDRFQP